VHKKGAQGPFLYYTGK